MNRALSSAKQAGVSLLDEAPAARLYHGAIGSCCSASAGVLLGVGAGTQQFTHTSSLFDRVTQVLVEQGSFWRGVSDLQIEFWTPQFQQPSF